MPIRQKNNQGSGAERLAVLMFAVTVIVGFMMWQKNSRSTRASTSGAGTNGGGATMDPNPPPIKNQKPSSIKCSMADPPLPTSAIDDGYCDCLENGNDELSTGACSTPQSKKTFSCGVKELPHIFPSRVCDGVCDCCNGADERKCPTVPGQVKVECPDTCAALLAKNEEDRKSVKAIKFKEAERKAHYGVKGGEHFVAFGKSRVRELLGKLNATTQWLLEFNRQVELNETLNITISEVAYEEALKMQQQREGYRNEIEKIRSWTAFIKDETQYGWILGKCWNLTRHEKIFRGGSAEAEQFNATFIFCPFDKVVQIMHREEDKLVTLGHYKGWAEVPLRALSGAAGTPQLVQAYTDGDPCWQGPVRFASVHMKCGLEDILTEVYEDGKCTYEVQFVTPAAC